MDGQRFDALTRLIGSGISRRRVLGALAGGAASALLGQWGGREAGAQEGCAPLGAGCDVEECCLGAVCGGGVCREPGSCAAEGETCGDFACCPELTCCSGFCRNTSSDPANCANCDNVCPTGQGCINFACQPTNPCEGVTCGVCQVCDINSGVCIDDCTAGVNCCGENGSCNSSTGQCTGSGLCGAINDPCGIGNPGCCGGLECDFSETCQPFQPQCGYEGSSCFNDEGCCYGRCCDGSCHVNFVCCPTDLISQNPDCAEGETCDNNGLCGPIPCAAEGVACSATGIACCPGSTCNLETLLCEADALPGCETDGDCSEGLICCDGVCGDQLCSECERDEDCDGDETCVEGACTPPDDGGCEIDDDCPGETICVSGVCLEKPDDGCERDDDCADGICCAGECRILDCCIDDPDPNVRCGEGETCFEGVCQPVEEPEPGRATITIHLARCPTGTDDLFTDCHDDGIAGVSFTVTSAGEVTIADTAVVTTDANGVAVATVGIGGVTIVQNGSVAAAYLGSYIYCSEQDGGTVLYDGSADDAAVSFVVADGDQVVCDWYGITDAEDDEDDEDDGGDDDDGDDVSDLPDTGTGTWAAPAGGLNGWLGAAALGAATAALAGAKLRESAEGPTVPVVAPGDGV